MGIQIAIYLQVIFHNVELDCVSAPIENEISCIIIIVMKYKNGTILSKSNFHSQKIGVI